MGDLEQRVALVAKGESDLDKQLEIGDFVLRALGPSCKVSVITSVYRHTRGLSNISLFNAYAGWPAFLARRRGDDDAAITADLARYSHLVSPSAYRADERYILRAEDERVLALEQVFLVESGLRIFDEVRPTHLFLGGAGTLIRTVMFALAQSRSESRYRILAAHHMTPKRGRRLYFFCDNDRGDLTDAPSSLFPDDPTRKRKYVLDFLNALGTRQERLDEYARREGRYWRVSRPGLGILPDLARLAVSLVRRNRLSANKLKYKMLYWGRNQTQRLIFDEPDKLSAPYILLPLNVPSDAQLRLRAPEWADAEALIRLCASNMPYGAQLVVKPHPGNPGMLSSGMIRCLRRDFPNILVVSHELSLNSLIAGCAAVVVINGSAALEAALHGRPCIYFGRSYFRRLPNVIHAPAAADIGAALLMCCAAETADYSDQLIEFLEHFYSQAYPPVGSLSGSTDCSIVETHAKAIVAILSSQKASSQKAHADVPLSSTP